MRAPARRMFLATAAAAALAVTAACGQADNMDDQGGGGGGGDDGGQVTLRWAWWGSDVRHEMNNRLIEMYEAENPNVNIEPDFTDWDSYWDRLATATAGGDTPDIMQQEERYLREYGSRGVLADLSQYDIDTSALDDSILASGEFDGGLYGLANGVNVYSLLANPRVFEDAGVPFPDDTTWTWDDFKEAMTAVGASGEDVYGLVDHNANEAGFHVYARQHGQALYTEDGQLGYEDELLVEYWNIALDLQESGGQTPASLSSEQVDIAPEQSLMGQGRAAVGVWWSNQLATLEQAAGEPLEIIRWPGETEFDQPGMYYKPGMFVSMSATTEHPEEAAAFIDWMNNSVEAGEVILTDRGLPTNLDVREAIMDDLPEPEQRAAEFLADLEDEVVDNPPVPPVGSGDTQEILTRYNTEVLFGRLTPEEAAAQFRAEVEAAIGQQ
ncbi:ABC transporter substrate-binding protein [Georgenia alba]|uniref:ABC transporter substrate-binding protein n=1 Tax=Georgenia alba TaxID=2233858 RepID=A0ABW2Q509_9MICO